jgi:hypothetical protein
MRRMEAVKPPVSYADLQRMPEKGKRYELNLERLFANLD